ncbi:MAG: M28 family peptidase [Candidatus Thorarchaeota archaeon]|nr:MAG: M28 family peptidase [Candidatus Thorarchaeota archaeon]
MESILNNVDSERLYKHILKTEGEKHPLHSPKRMEACADYILKEFESYGLNTSVHKFEVEGLDNTFRNIEATVGGSGPELLIVSHYDTVHSAPGANDNGSAITVMLEAARILSEHPPEGAVRFVSFNLEELNPARIEKINELRQTHGIMDEEYRFTTLRASKTVKKYWELFVKYQSGVPAFSDISERVLSELKDDLQPHELEYLKGLHALNDGITDQNYHGKIGLMGSSAWVRDAPARCISVKGVLCLETIGYVSSKKHSQTLPEGIGPDMFKIFNTDPEIKVGDFLTIVGDCNSGLLAEALCTQCELDYISLPYACLQGDFNYEQAAASMPDILRSDHGPFWREGIPALLITDTANFRYPFYHTPADTIDKLDFDFLSKICKAVVATALQF